MDHLTLIRSEHLDTIAAYFNGLLENTYENFIFADLQYHSDDQPIVVEVLQSNEAFEYYLRVHDTFPDSLKSVMKIMES